MSASLVVTYAVICSCVKFVGVGLNIFFEAIRKFQRLRNLYDIYILEDLYYINKKKQEDHTISTFS